LAFTKGANPFEDSLLKLLYLGIQNAKRKWIQPIPNWGYNSTPQNVPFLWGPLLFLLSIFFEGRLENALKP